MGKKEVNEVVKKSIGRLLRTFKNDNKTTFNSESDIKCYLYHLLMKSRLCRSGYVIGTEMPNGKKRRYDIAILYQKKPVVAIEIKFNPQAGRSLKENGSTYKDIEKIEAVSYGYGHLLILSNHERCSEKLIDAYKAVEKKRKKGLDITICHVNPETHKVEYNDVKKPVI